MLSNESTEEEVVKFFIEKCKISEDIQNKLKSENITGEVLPLLTKNDFKDSFNFKFANFKKWEIYYNENKDKFTPKEIKEAITPYSTEEEVKSFFERCLSFKGALENMNGKKLIELNEEEMKKIGLNLGKRKRLIKYIKYFKTLNPKESTEDVADNILITRTSSEEDVTNFLKLKLKISKNSIDEIALDGESLFELNENDIEMLDILNEEKEKLKNYIRKLKSFEEPQKHIITKESSVEEVAEFLKNVFEIPENIIDDLGLDGDSFLIITEEDVDGFDISEEQKNSWKKYLKEQNSINEESSKEQVKNFLKNKLSFSDISLNQMNYDGKTFLLLKEFKIKNLNINEEEKNKLKDYLKKDQIILTDEKDEKSISQFLDDKFGLSIESFNSSALEIISNEIKVEEKNILEKFLLSKDKTKDAEFLKKAKQIKEITNHLTEEKKFTNFKGYKLVPLAKNNKYNFIFFVVLKEIEVDDFCLAIYEEYDKDFLNHKPKFIFQCSYKNNHDENCRAIFMQIQSEIPFKNKINIVIKNHATDGKFKINLEDKNKLFFYFDNINFDTFIQFEELKIYHIIFFYYIFIFDEKKNLDKAIKIGFLKELFDLINTRNETTFYGDIFIYIIKQSLKLKVEPKNFNSIKIKEVEANQKIILKPEYYLTAEEIDKLKLGEQKSNFLEVIIRIYSRADIILKYIKF